MNNVSLATLYIFFWPPCSGKSTLAKLLSAKTGSMYVRVDTVEQALRDLCNVNVEGEATALVTKSLKTI